MPKRAWKSDKRMYSDMGANLQKRFLREQRQPRQEHVNDVLMEPGGLPEQPLPRNGAAEDGVRSDRGTTTSYHNSQRHDTMVAT